jgi:hypothetical protein
MMNAIKRFSESFLSAGAATVSTLQAGYQYLVLNPLVAAAILAFAVLIGLILKINHKLNKVELALNGLEHDNTPAFLKPASLSNPSICQRLNKIDSKISRLSRSNRSI